MKTNNKMAHFFSLAAVSFENLKTGPVGLIEVPASLELSGVTPESITTRGGFSDFPVAARAGARTGEAKLAVNECPSWLERIANGGSVATYNAPMSGGTAIETGVRVSGTSDDLDNISTKLTATDEAASGTYFFTISGGNIKIDAHTEKGRFYQEIAAADFGATTVLAGTGVSIANPDAVTGAAIVAVSVRAAFTEAAYVQYQTHSIHDEYRITAWSVRGRSPQDALIEIKLNRVMLMGMENKLTDNEAVSGVEIALQMLAPTNGTDPVWEKYHLNIG